MLKEAINRQKQNQADLNLKLFLKVCKIMSGINEKQGQLNSSKSVTMKELDDIRWSLPRDSIDWKLGWIGLVFESLAH